MERVSEGSIDKVKSLIKAAADTNIQDEVGKSALMLAAEMGHTKIISHLLQACANPELKDVAGHTAIEYALRKRKDKQNKEIIKLLTFGIEDSDKTDLMLAAKIGDEKTIIALIDSGADLEAKDKDGKTAIDHATDKDLRRKLSQSLKIYRKAKEELSKVCAQEEGHTLSSILGKLDNFDELNSLAPFGLTEDKIAKAKIKFLLEVKDSAGKTPLKKLRQDAHTLDTDKLGSLKSKIEKLYQKDSNKNRKSELKRIVNKILKLITPKSILQRKKIDKMITRLQTSPIQSRPPQATSIPEQTTKMRGGRKK
jgi:ankyrin repeat protein